MAPTAVVRLVFALLLVAGFGGAVASVSAHAAERTVDSPLRCRILNLWPEGEDSVALIGCGTELGVRVGMRSPRLTRGPIEVVEAWRWQSVVRLPQSHLPGCLRRRLKMF